ncbi:MAG: aspartate kinase, partial [bacterium]|nr:aspartate kinase [bacterium]
MQVLKFGGTSLATAQRLETVCDIIGRAATDDRVVVVVSALGGVTDALVSAIGAAVERDSAVVELVDRLAVRHREQLHELVGSDGCAQTEGLFEIELVTLRNLLDGVSLLGVCPPSAEHRILSVGERLSAPLLAAVLRARGIPAEPVDGASLITTDARAQVETERSAERIVERLGALPPGVVPVVTGFIAADAEGRTITLGRGGSDHTATLLAGALEARLVELWTDVDGVLSADPRWVSETRPVPCLDFDEAAELAFFGAKVLHPKTITPLE